MKPSDACIDGNGSCLESVIGELHGEALNRLCGVILDVDAMPRDPARIFRVKHDPDDEQDQYDGDHGYGNLCVHILAEHNVGLNRLGKPRQRRGLPSTVEGVVGMSSCPCGEI